MITLRSPDRSGFNCNSTLQKDGIILEKGVVLTNEFLEKNEELFQKYAQFFSVYPDIFLDLLKPQNSNISLFPYQRIFLRAVMRFTTIYITAARATSKTFLSILGKYLQCIFIPNHVGSIVAPNKNQAAKIAKQKIEEIWRYWPLLEKEIEKANFGKDYVDIYFKNKSRLSIVGALDSDRGIRTHATLIDEVRDQDGDMISEVILPQMNVSRRMLNGEVNPYEKINTQVIYATSAGAKTSFAYEALIDTFTKAVIEPDYNFNIGLDYRVPAMHGLIDPKYVQNLKMSSSYNETTFSAEYLANWQGGNDEAWFNFEKLQKYRKIKNPEKHAIFREGANQFYLLSVDVGRLNDQTVVCVFRVNIKEDKYYATLINLYVLGRTPETKPFSRQAADLKEIIALFNPKEVVIDCNGLGLGIADEMIREQYNDKGELLEPLGFFNNDDYKKIQPKQAQKILYSLKANGPLNSKIHGNCYSRLSSGMVRFLIKEQEAKSLLLSSKTGRKMSIEKRIERLMPHEMTTKLFEEMANLRLKRTGVGLDIVLEQINSRFPKDKYSAFAYGLWRIKELEEEAQKKNRRRFGATCGSRKLTFFTGGN